MGWIPGSGRFLWRRKWQPTPVFLPGESHGQRSLVGYSPWGHRHNRMTKPKRILAASKATNTRTDWKKTFISHIFNKGFQFSHSVTYDSLRPHGLQQARLSCPSPTPGVYSNSCPLSRWCHPTISSSVIPFSSRLQSFPASRSSPRSWFFTSGDQSIRVLASASALPMNIQDWFPLGLTGWISLQSKGLLRVLFNTTVLKNQFFGPQFSLQSNSHIHTSLLEKNIALTRWTFVGKVMPLLFNMLSRLATTFLPRSKHLFISWLQSIRGSCIAYIKNSFNSITKIERTQF